MNKEIAPRPYEPDVAIHPGATIRDMLEEKGMNQQELAVRMKRPPNKINEIIHGKREITVETALELELVLGLPANFWLELERNYQLANARFAAEKQLLGQTEMVKKFPIREMVRLGWLRLSSSASDKVRQLFAFFGVASFEQLNKPNVCAPAFRKACTEEASPYALAAWLRRGTLEALKIDTATFSATGLRESIPALRAMTAKSPDIFQPALVDICAKHGVATVFVPHLSKSYACGAAYWVGNRAVVQLSLLLNTDDQLWFSFFHELGHLLLHGKREAFLDDFKTDSNSQEQEANMFAFNALISEVDYHKLKTLDFHNKSVISEFAKEIAIAPGIIIHRLQHDNLLSPSSHLNSLKIGFTWTKENSMWTLDNVIDLLNEHHQRATYGAVAGVVGGIPNGLMNGRTPCYRDSWVVAKTTNNKSGSLRGWPTDYTDDQIHSQCLRQIRSDISNFLDNEDDLREWLDSLVWK